MKYRVKTQGDKSADGEGRTVADWQPLPPHDMRVLEGTAVLARQASHGWLDRSPLTYSPVASLSLQVTPQPDTEGASEAERELGTPHFQRSF